MVAGLVLMDCDFGAGTNVSWFHSSQGHAGITGINAMI